MSELKKESGGSEPISSAVGESNESTTSSAVSDSATKHIDKLLKEKQNAMKGLGEVKVENEQLKETIKGYQEKDLLETQQHEKIIDLQKQEITGLKGELGNYQTRECEGRKGLAIMSELKKLGFVDNDSNRDIAMKLFNKDNVEIDPTSNVVLGADMAAKAFYDKYHTLGLFGKKQPGTNQQAVDLTNTTSGKSISDMDNKEKASKLKDALTNLVGQK